nr:hypothetical protein [Tanacetum cinerariifolium]
MHQISRHGLCINEFKYELTIFDNVQKMLSSSAFSKYESRRCFRKRHDPAIFSDNKFPFVTFLTEVNSVKVYASSNDGHFFIVFGLQVAAVVASFTLAFLDSLYAQIGEIASIQFWGSDLFKFNDVNFDDISATYFSSKVLAQSIKELDTRALGCFCFD